MRRSKGLACAIVASAALGFGAATGSVSRAAASPARSSCETFVGFVHSNANAAYEVELLEREVGFRLVDRFGAVFVAHLTRVQSRLALLERDDEGVRVLDDLQLLQSEWFVALPSSALDAETAVREAAVKYRVPVDHDYALILRGFATRLRLPAFEQMMRAQPQISVTTLNYLRRSLTDYQDQAGNWHSLPVVSWQVLDRLEATPGVRPLQWSLASTDDPASHPPLPAQAPIVCR